MKQFIALTRAAIMALSLTGCGEDEKKPSQSTGKSSSSVQTDQNSSDIIENADTTTVEGYLNTFGFTTTKVECANVIRVDALSYDDAGNVTKVGVFVYSLLGTDNMNAWLKKILNHLESISDDGVVNNSGKLKPGNDRWTEEFVTNKENGWDEERNDRMMLDGEYLYKGKKIGIYLEVNPFATDSSNPENAIPSCVISFEYR